MIESSSMIKIPRSLLFRSEDHLVGEASTVGLQPGRWPQLIAVVEEGLRGDVVSIYRRGAAVVRQFDEILSVRYHADDLPSINLLNT